MRNFLRGNLGLAGAAGLRGFLACAFLGCAFLGCTPKKAPYANSQAEQKLTSFIKEEYKEDVTVRTSGNTLYVYAPSTKPLFEYKAEEPKDAKPAKYSIEYLKCAFADRAFTVRYDIIPTTLAKSTEGITNAYSEEFNTRYRGIFAAVTRFYLNTETPPEFVVIIFADIKNGLELVNTFNFEDLKRFQSGSMPQQEYMLRALSKSRGSKAIVGDTTGAHLDYKEVTWGDFLSRQIENRITFKFTKSDFPPQKRVEEEILGIVQACVSAYNFTDFSKVILKDLRSSSTLSLERSALLHFAF